MKSHKQQLRIAIRTSVVAVMNQYRVSAHREWDKTLDDLCEELQFMKHEKTHRCKLLSVSEWQGSLKRRKKFVWHGRKEVA